MHGWWCMGGHLVEARHHVPALCVLVGRLLLGPAGQRLGERDGLRVARAARHRCARAEQRHRARMVARRRPVGDGGGEGVVEVAHEEGAARLELLPRAHLVRPVDQAREVVPQPVEHEVGHHRAVEEAAALDRRVHLACLRACACACACACA